MKILRKRIDALLAQGPAVIAIDGRCGSGKTTLAAALAEWYDCNVIHIDDFFLRPEQRTEQRLATPGENVDHERFLKEVLLPLQTGKSFSYCPFDCSTGTLGAPITVEPKALTVVEGSYSLHPSLRPYYRFSIFLDVDAETQMRRIVKRNALSAETFRTKWIPLEEAYFAACNVRECCDILYQNQ